MRRLKRVERRKPGEFRLLRWIGMDGVRSQEEAREVTITLNLVRFHKHVWRLGWRQLS